MEWERYQQFFVSEDALEFTFDSIGPKGVITMIVQFKQTNDPEIYNLAFGNLLPNGKVDHHTKNDNSIDFEIYGVVPEKDS